MLTIVLEYLIRNAADHGWPAFHASRFAEVLIPNGEEWQQVAGPGDFCIVSGDVSVELAGEMNGWQVAVKGAEDEDAARLIVDTIARQVESEVGHRVEVVEI